MKKLIDVVIFCALVICLFFFYSIYKLLQSKQDIPEANENIEKLDSVLNVQEVLIKQIDTIIIERSKNEEQYKKDVGAIISNDDSTNLVFFHEYINTNKERLDSINNSF